MKREVSQVALLGETPRPPAPPIRIECGADIEHPISGSKPHLRRDAGAVTNNDLVTSRSGGAIEREAFATGNRAHARP